MSRAMHRAERLDKSGDAGAIPRPSYKVKNMAAKSLVAILTGVQSKGSVGSGSKIPSGKSNLVAAVATQTDAPPTNVEGSANFMKNVQFVADTQGNRVLVNGTDSDFARVKSILSQLDVPS